MSILVTGASGFLGRYLVAHLEATRSEPITAVVQHGAKIWDSPAKKVVIDLTHRAAVSALITASNPTEVYHLAGYSRVTDELGLPDYFNANFLTTAYLSQALVARARPVRFFLASSIHVYGNTTEVVSEGSAVRPFSNYGFTKYIAEEFLKKCTLESPELSVVVGRLYSCFGPGQALGFVSSDLCQKISKLPSDSTAELSVGPISTFRRFLDVRDAVSLFPRLLALPNPPYFQVVNVASPYEAQIKDLIDIILDIAGKTARVRSAEDSSTNRLTGIKLKCDLLAQLLPDARFRPIKETLTDMYRHHQLGGVYGA